MCFQLQVYIINHSNRCGNEPLRENLFFAYTKTKAQMAAYRAFDFAT